MVTQKDREARRKAREKQLKTELSIKRKEKEEAKAKAEAEKKEKMRLREERRKKKKQEKKEYFEENKRKINEWKKLKKSEKEQEDSDRKAKEKTERLVRNRDFAEAQKRRDHLNNERVEQIKADAKKYGIAFETENLETYGVTIKNVDQVEREIKAKKKLEQEKLARQESSKKYNENRKKVQQQMKEREEYEKRTTRSLEDRLENMNLTATEFVIEMLKVRLGIGGPERTDHRAMRLHDLFGRIDDDTSGSISKEEMQKAFQDMKINLDEAQLNEFFTEFDPNGDGSLDYEEFLSQMRTHIHGGQGVVKRTSTSKKKKNVDDTSDAADDSSTPGTPPPPPKKESQEDDDEN